MDWRSLEPICLEALKVSLSMFIASFHTPSQFQGKQFHSAVKGRQLFSFCLIVVELKSKTLDISSLHRPSKHGPTGLPRRMESMAT